MARLLALSAACALAAACARSGAPAATTPVTAAVAASAADSATGVYYPAPGNAWLTARPSAAGLDSAGLAAAVSYAQASEIAWSLDMKLVVAAVGK